MPVPKRRTTRSRKGTRRSHHALRPVQTVLCSRCNNPSLPHTVCGNCGWYQGQQIIGIVEK
ncbi:MAG: 50S ribosomal protein L32 [Planctomycetia bacterium]|nr:50S ribosomal protein L32 [Planctomycetia bacterium]